MVGASEHDELGVGYAGSALAALIQGVDGVVAGMEDQGWASHPPQIIRGVEIVDGSAEFYGVFRGGRQPLQLR